MTMAHTIDYATYTHDYCVDVLFDGGTLETVSLRDFISASDNPLITQYKDIEKFKKDFSFDKHGLHWANDMSVSADWAYSNTIQSPNIENTDYAC